MRRQSLLERFGSSVLGEGETPIDRRAKHWLWSGWGVSAFLGFLMPLYRGTTHIHGSAVVGAAVMVMIAVSAATRRPMIGLTMSGFGLVTGAAPGFGLLAALTHRPVAWAITVQMVLGAVFLGRVFLRELRPRPEPSEDPFWEEVSRLPKEEAQARVIARFNALRFEADSMSAKLDRMQGGINAMIAGGVVALVGGVIMLVGSHTAWSEGSSNAALATLGVGTVVVAVGARRTWAVYREPGPSEESDRPH